jgi:hypothetical protein
VTVDDPANAPSSRQFDKTTGDGLNFRQQAVFGNARAACLEGRGYSKMAK